MIEIHRKMCEVTKYLRYLGYFDLPLQRRTFFGENTFVTEAKHKLILICTRV